MTDNNDLKGSAEDELLREIARARAEIETERDARIRFDAGFSRLPWGSLRRKHEGLADSVDACGCDQFTWSIEDENSVVRRSPTTYILEEFALDALAVELGLVPWAPKEAWE
jgi:hypothetical protein